MLRVKRIGKRQRQLAPAYYESDPDPENGTSVTAERTGVQQLFRNFDVTGGLIDMFYQSFAPGRRWRNRRH